MPWSEWKILSKENFNTLPQSAGVYKIKYLKKIIGRLVKRDQKGILMIGQSKKLKTRLKKFYEVIQGHGNGHSEGERFYKLKLRKKFPPENMLFKFSKVRRGANPKNRESKELESYQKTFGELPPLNNAGGV